MLNPLSYQPFILITGLLFYVTPDSATDGNTAKEELLGLHDNKLYYTFWWWLCGTVESTGKVQ